MRCIDQPRAPLNGLESLGSSVAKSNVDLPQRCPLGTVQTHRATIGGNSRVPRRRAHCINAIDDRTDVSHLVRQGSIHSAGPIVTIKSGVICTRHAWISERPLRFFLYPANETILFHKTDGYGAIRKMMLEIALRLSEKPHVHMRGDKILENSPVHTHAPGTIIAGAAIIAIGIGGYHDVTVVVLCGNRTEKAPAVARAPRDASERSHALP